MSKKQIAAWLVVLGIGFVLVVSNRPHSNSTKRVRISENVTASLPIPLELVKPHLATAEERITEATRNHFGPIDSVLDRSRSQSDQFASLALGWSSKWRIVADAIPFTQGDRNAIYLREQFERIVLKGSDLEKAMEQSVQEFIADIRSIESKMLVDLRADIQHLSNDYQLAKVEVEELQTRFDEAIENAMQVASTDLQANISSQLVSIVVGEVLTQVAVRLGVSAGILGAGAASGWATLGVGVVVGIVIDQIVMSVWSRWSNPKEQLVDALHHQLNVVQDMICLGDGQTKGLVKHFEEIAKSRSQLRRIAIMNILGIEDPSSKTQQEMK
jgi:hypothetical protein